MGELIAVGAYCAVFMALGLRHTRSQQRFPELYEPRTGEDLGMAAEAEPFRSGLLSLLLKSPGRTAS